MRNLIDHLLRDLRYGLRSLRKDRRLALLATCALGMGIGASTLVFRVIYNGLRPPFPYKGGDRLVNFMIHDVKESRPGGRSGYSMTEMLDYRDQNHVLEDVMGCNHTDVLYNNGEDRKSTRLNSSHGYISYAVFCLKKKKQCCETRC